LEATDAQVRRARNCRLQIIRLQISVNGVLIIDKPRGMTSHDVVNCVRRILRQRSVGHLGTLDPSATGVLPIVVGHFTRLAQFYTDSDKKYEGVIRFGFATDTYDADGEATSASQNVILNEEDVRRLAAEFRGVLRQIPPPFSAKKIAGVPAYKLARRHREVKLEPVQVKVKALEILGVSGDCAEFRAHVGSGTYMRSIAHDMGQRLGCGAHLGRLRRTAVAEFTIEEAHTLGELETKVRQGRAEDIFFHPRKLLPQMPSVTATDENVALIRTGRAVNLPEMSKAPLVKVFHGQRDLIAISTRIAGTLFHPSIVFPASEG